MDRSDKPTDRNRAARQEPPRRPEYSFHKERVEKDDGRYIIFYTFGDEEAAEGEGA